jgi:hypothetical protein
MLFGCAIGVVFGMFFPVSLMFSVSLGAGIGYLFVFLLMKFIARKDTIIHKYLSSRNRRDCEIRGDNTY